MKRRFLRTLGILTASGALLISPIALAQQESDKSRNSTSGSQARVEQTQREGTDEKSDVREARRERRQRQRTENEQSERRQPDADRAALGVSLDPNSSGSRVGVRIMGVLRNSPAAEAGLTAGDQIIRLQGRPVSHAREIMSRMKEMDPGEEITLFLQSADGRREEVDVKLSSVGDLQANSLREPRAAQQGQQTPEWDLERQFDDTTRQMFRDQQARGGMSTQGKLPWGELMADMRAEMRSLRRRVEELEEQVASYHHGGERGADERQSRNRFNRGADELFSGDDEELFDQELFDGDAYDRTLFDAYSRGQFEEESESPARSGDRRSTSDRN